MFSSDEFSARLPAPRDDEPESLRRDIVDELGDHLACAIRREMLTGRGEEGDARRRVLARFGDPAALVRRLWRDALWEQIMSQRLLIGMCLATLGMCAAALGMIWTWMNQSQAANASLIERQQVMFERLMESSQQMAAANAKRTDELLAKGQPLAEWNPVEIRCLVGANDGLPLEGVAIELMPLNKETGALPADTETDADGVAKFSKVRFGQYTLVAKTPSHGFWQKTITLLPGEPFQKTILCPQPVSHPLEVELRVKWPDDLQQEPLVLELSDTTLVRLAGPFRWQYQGQGWPANRSSGRTSLFVRSDKEPYWSQAMVNRESVLNRANDQLFLDGLQRDLRSTLGYGSSERVELTATKVAWPAEDTAILGARLLIEKPWPNHDSSGTPGRFALSLSCAKWRYQVERGLVTLSPDDDSLQQIRVAITKIDQLVGSEKPSSTEPNHAPPPSSGG